MQGCGLFTPAVTRGFGLGQLETVLKSAMQAAGVEGQPSVLLIEDHHVTSDDILETINSLLSAGERGVRPRIGGKCCLPRKHLRDFCVV